jgi:hypothetical protein
MLSDLACDRYAGKLIPGLVTYLVRIGVALESVAVD